VDWKTAEKDYDKVFGNLLQGDVAPQNVVAPQNDPLANLRAIPQYEDFKAAHGYENLSQHGKQQVYDAYAGKLQQAGVSEDVLLDLENIAPRPKDIDRTWGEASMDSLASLSTGLYTLPKMAGDLYGLATDEPDNALSLWAEDKLDSVDSAKSEHLLDKQQERSEIMAQADGTVDEAAIAVWETVKNPALATSFIFELAPNLLPTGAVGRGLQALTYSAKTASMLAKLAKSGGKPLSKEALEQAAKSAAKAGVAGGVATGAAMQAADVGDQNYDELMRIPEETWRKNAEFVELAEQVGADEAKQRMALGMAKIAALQASALSLVTAGLPWARAVEKGLLKGKSGIGIIRSSIGESFQEGVEEGGGQIASNLQIQNVDESRSTTEGVGEALGLGVLGGGVLGGGVGAFNRKRGAKKVAKGGEAKSQSADLQSELINEGAESLVPQTQETVIQNRNRNTPASIVQMQAIASEPDYQRVSYSRDFANGAPVVTEGDVSASHKGVSEEISTASGRKIPIQYAVVEANKLVPSHNADGTVVRQYENESNFKAIAGNARIAGLQSAYESKTAHAYKASMEQDKAHGIDGAVIRKMKRPILVRMMSRADVTSNIGDESNVAGMQALSTVEQANNDRRRINLEALSFNDDGSVSNEAIKQFVMAMPVSEQSALVDTNKQPTRQAEDRLNAAIFAQAYRDDRLIRLYAQAKDTEARNIMSALANAAPAVSRLSGNLDFRDELQKAASIAISTKRKGRKLSEAVSQQEIDEDRNVVRFLRLFADNANSTKAISEKLKEVAKFAYDETVKPKSDMFGDVPVATKDEVLSRLQAEEKTTGEPKPQSSNDVGTDTASAKNEAAKAVPAKKEAEPAQGQADSGSITGRTGRDEQREEKVAPEKARTAEEKPGQQEEITSKEPKEPVEKSPRKSKIEDFGEVLHGAKKHEFSFREKLESATDDDLINKPLSEIWPVPDYNKLIEEGADKKAVALIRAMRDTVPNKPKTAYAVHKWVNELKLIRQFAIQVADNEDVLKKLEENKIFDDILDRASLYEKLGHEYSFRGIRIGNWYKDIWKIRSRNQVYASGNTKQAAINQFIDFVKNGGLKQIAKDKRLPKFVAYYKTGKGDSAIYIGVKIGRNYLDLEKFEDREAAKAYLRDNKEELQKQYDKLKAIPFHRKQENAPRDGEEYRASRDVAPEDFQNTFGFRGVQFGNYVEQKKRQDDLNEAYDALMDMSYILGIKPAALSLHGELGLAFGARGRGGKNAPQAHYDATNVVINLTKGGGAGSLAHEWFHSLDHYFAKRGDKQGTGYITKGKENESVRAEIHEAFNYITKVIGQTGIKARSKALDRVKGKVYYSDTAEMAARSFEAYIIKKLAEKKISNDYLASVIPAQSWEMVSESERVRKAYPYPLDNEMPAITKVFDNLFETIKERKTDKGIELYSIKTDSIISAQQKPQQIREAINKTFGKAAERIEVVDKKTQDIAAGSRLQFLPEASYNRNTDKIMLNVSAMEAMPELGINTPIERALIVAAHELAHRGKHVLDKNKVAFNKAFAELKKNKVVSAIAVKVQEERLQMEERFHISESIAMEEAAVELVAAQETGNYAYIEKRYGYKVPVGLRKTTQGAINRFIEKIKAWFKTVSGADVDAYQVLRQMWSARNSVLHQQVADHIEKGNNVIPIIRQIAATMASSVVVVNPAYGDSAPAINARQTIQSVNITGLPAKTSAVISWAMENNDHKGKPFLIADKKAGMLYRIAPDGTVAHESPALFGKSIGDEAVRNNTPAGAFELKIIPINNDRYGDVAQFKRIDTDVFAVHRMVNVSGQNRRARLDSVTPSDNRISAGCINVPSVFYDNHVKDAGKIYILPESRERFSFAGINAKDADKSKLAEAQNMAARGSSVAEIWEETGWIKGVDGKWRFEVDDNKVKLHLKRGKVNSGKLKEFVAHTALFRQYPNIKDIDLEIDVSEKNAVSGVYNPGVPGRISVTATSESQATSILLHEIQHAIQEIEQFARGGNAGEFSHPSAWELEAIDTVRTARIALEQADSYNMDYMEFANNPPSWLTKSATLLLKSTNGDRERLESNMSWIENQDIRFPEQKYRDLAGEAEAREVEKRYGKSVEWRSNNVPSWDGVAETSSMPEPPKVHKEFAETEKEYGGRNTYDKAKSEGKTKLNYRQWVQVRTPSFKKWFGDWEKDAEIASKVIDEETGEPLVVYRGSPEKTGMIFEYNKNYYGGNRGFWFTSAETAAKDYSFNDVTGDTGDVKAVFINAKNLLDLLPLGRRTTSRAFYSHVRESFGINLGVNGSSKEFMVEQLYGKHQEALYPGAHDGIKLVDVGHTYIVKRPNQIKSATDNIGEFLPDNPDIRYSTPPPHKTRESGFFDRPNKADDVLDMVEDGYVPTESLIDSAASIRSVGELQQAAENAWTKTWDTLNDNFHDGLAVVKRWADTLPVSDELKSELKDSLYLGSGVVQYKNKEVFNFYLKDVYQKLNKLSQSSGIDLPTTQKLVGYWMSANYIPKANAWLIGKDAKAVENAQEALQKNPGDAQIKGAVTKAENQLKERQAAVANKQLKNVVNTIGVAGGLNNAQAAAMKAGVEKRLSVEDIQGIAGDIYSILEWKKQLDLSSGKVTQQMVNSWPQHEDYVPLTGSPFSDTESDVFNVGSSIPNISREKAINGRTDSVADDGLVASIGAVEKSINHAGYQDFKRALNAVYESALDARGGSHQAAAEMVGMSREAEKGLTRISDDVIIYRDKGQAHVFHFENKEVIDAIKRNNLDDQTGLLRLVSTPTRIYARMATLYEPFFFITNWTKDVWEKSELIRVRDIKDANGKPVNTDKAGRRLIGLQLSYDLHRATWRGAWMKDNPGYAGKMLTELLEQGGVSTWGEYLSRQHKELISDIKWEGGLRGKAKVANEMVQAWNQAFELKACLSAYMALREQGVTKKRAAAESLDLMNFRKRGKHMAIPRSIWVFSQPAVTGGANLLKILSTAKGRRRFLAYTVVGIIAYTVLRSMDDEDEGGTRLDQQSPFLLERYIPIPTGNGGYIKIPVGFGLPVYSWNVAVNLVKAMNDEQTGLETLGEIAIKANVKNMTPLNLSEIPFSKYPVQYAAVALAPTIFKPELEVAMNKGMFGNDIVSKFVNERTRYLSEQKRANTPDEYQAIAVEIRDIFGFDFAPEQTRTLIRGHAVGLLRSLLDVTIENPHKESLGKQAKTPILSRFWTPGNQYGVTGRYYGYLAEAEAVLKEKDAGNSIRGKEFELRWLQKYEKMMRSLRARKAATTRMVNSGRLNSTLAKQRRQQLDKERERIMAKAVYEMRRHKGLNTTRKPLNSGFSFAP